MIPRVKLERGERVDVLRLTYTRLYHCMLSTQVILLGIGLQYIVQLEIIPLEILYWQVNYPMIDYPLRGYSPKMLTCRGSYWKDSCCSLSYDRHTRYTVVSQSEIPNCLPQVERTLTRELCKKYGKQDA